MCKSKGREEETSDVVQMRLALAGLLEEMAALGLASVVLLCSTLWGRDINKIFS